jgi:hypothetical protein
MTAVTGPVLERYLNVTFACVWASRCAPPGACPPSVRHGCRGVNRTRRLDRRRVPASAICWPPTHSPSDSGPNRMSDRSIRDLPSMVWRRSTGCTDLTREPFIGPNRPADAAPRPPKPAPARTLSDREALWDMGLEEVDQRPDVMTSRRKSPRHAGPAGTFAFFRERAGSRRRTPCRWP